MLTTDTYSYVTPKCYDVKPPLPLTDCCSARTKKRAWKVAKRSDEHDNGVATQLPCCPDVAVPNTTLSLMNRGWVAQLVEHRSVNYPWGLIDPDQEKRAAEFFPWQQVSPEEYAAHNAHTILVFSYSLYRFNSPDLQIWMHRLAEILHSEDLLRQARDRFLTTERRAEIEAHIDAQNAEFDRWLEESEEDEP